MKLTSVEVRCKDIKSMYTLTEDSSKTENANDANMYECRACLQKFCAGDSLFDLFQLWLPPWGTVGNTYADELSRLANIQITATDTFSKLICQHCHVRLLDACRFIASVHQNDQILRTRMDTVEPPEEWPKPIQVDRSVDTTIFGSTMEIEVKQEPLSEDEADGTEECIVPDLNKEPMDLANLDIKIEPEEILEPPQIKITVNGTITQDQYAQNSISTNGGDHLCDNNLDIPVKQEPQSEEEDSDVVPDLPLECMLCAKSFNSVSGLKAHVIAQHSYKTVKRKSDGEPPSVNGEHNKYVCALCRRKFTTSTDLMVHETCHNKHACYGCSEMFDTFVLLTRHREKCKAVISKAAKAKKPKTLEDVKRTHIESPQLPEQTLPQSPSILSAEESEVKVHLQIQSLTEEDEAGGNVNDVDMKVEPVDTFSEDEVIQ